MAEYLSPMWWTQQFAIWSNVVLWGFILIALFAPGLIDIKNWLRTANFSWPSKENTARHRVERGTVDQGDQAVADHQSGHRSNQESAEVSA